MRQLDCFHEMNVFNVGTIGTAVLLERELLPGNSLKEPFLLQLVKNAFIEVFVQAGSSLGFSFATNQRVLQSIVRDWSETKTAGQNTGKSLPAPPGCPASIWS